MNEEIEWAEDDFIEIDYGEYGFVVRTPISTSDWKVIFDDPDRDSIQLPKEESSFPVKIDEQFIDWERFLRYEALRQHPK